MCKIHFRLVRDFNEIHRFSIFAFFIWAVLGVCNIFLTLQFQLVEKFFNDFLDFYLTDLLYYHFKDGWKFENDRYHHECSDCRSDICIPIHRMRARRTSDRSIRAIRWWAHSMQLVYAAHWHTAIVFDISGEHPAINQYSVLWWNFVHTWNIQKCNFTFQTTFGL